MYDDENYGWGNKSGMNKLYDQYEPKMSWKKKLLILLGVVAVVLILGRVFTIATDRKKMTGNLTRFEYSSGSYNGGYYNYQLTKNTKGTATFVAEGGNGVDMDINVDVDLSYMDQLATLINEYGLYKWNNFHKSDNRILDGHSFSLKAIYDDGRSINAGGYMKYPAGYQQGSAALNEFFEALCRDLTGGTDEQVSKALEGYADYLKAHTELWEKETVYAVDYINDDKIPDLIFGDTEAAHASNIYILTYLDGNYDDVVCAGPFGAYGATCYYPEHGIMLSSNMGMGYDSEYYSKLTTEGEDGYETVCHRYFYYEEDYEGEPTEVKFFIGAGEDNEVSEEEYGAFVKELVGDTKYTVFYTYNNDNGYKYLDQDAIDNLFDMN